MTKKDDKIHLNISGEMAASIREMQIRQSLAGLKLMPYLLERLEEMAAQGDEVAQEVVRRYKEEASNED